MKTDVLVIGGSAAGLVAAMTAKSNFPDKDVVVIRKEAKVMIPCGIPYVFGSVGTTDKNILPDGGLINLGVNIIVDEVININKEEKICSTKLGEDIQYNKLIITTGSLPTVPTFIKGYEKENVFTVLKDKVYLDDMHSKLNACKDIVVVGAGFIGVEISDELAKEGKNITLIEILPEIMATAYDVEFSKQAEELITERGVKVITGIGVKEILGDNKAEKVLLGNGETLKADAVIVSCGYRPNTKLANDMGIKLNEFNFIKVDQYMRTEHKDIYAAGDCAEKRDFATGKISRVMLASTACAEARVAAMNLYKLSTIKSFKGTIGIYSTDIDGTCFGVAGLTETMALKENFEVITGSFTGVDRHPGCIADAKKQTVKLIAASESGVLLGGEVSGGKGAGELINVIGFAIQNHMAINDFLVAQIGTQPMLTASPAGYPLIKAAEICAKKMRN